MRALINTTFRITFLLVFILILWSFYNLVLPPSILQKLTIGLFIIGALNIFFPSSSTVNKKLGPRLETALSLGILITAGVITSQNQSIIENADNIVNILEVVILVILFVRYLIPERGEISYKPSSRIPEIVVIIFLVGVGIYWDFNILRLAISWIFLWVAGGFFWMNVFYRGQLDPIARVVAGTMVSLVCLPLLLYYLSLVGFTVDKILILTVNSLFAISGYVTHLLLERRFKLKQA